jgi:hypothetical protein
MIPDIEEMTITEAERWPWLSSPAWSKGRSATVVNYLSLAFQRVMGIGSLTYTADTLVLNVSDHWEKDSPLNSLSFSSEAFSLSGSALGPATPAFFIRKLIHFSFLLILATRFSRSSFSWHHMALHYFY